MSEKDKKKKERKEIEVNINTDGMTEIIKRNKELEQKLKESEEERLNYRSKLIVVAQSKFEQKKRELGAPDDIESPEVLKHWAETHADEKRRAERRADPVGHGGAGVVPLSGQSGSGSGTEFSSQEELIDSLREQSRSRDAAEKANAEKILNELFSKGLRGMGEVKNYRTSYEGKESTRDKMNEQFRKGKKKEKEDEK